jgi:hypothetical protein
VIRGLRVALAPAVLLAAVGVLLALQTGIWRAGERPAAAPTAPVVQAASLPQRQGSGAAPRIALGATTEALARNSYRRWRPGDLRSVDEVERVVRRPLGVVMWFADWESVAAPDLRQLRAVAARGSVPEITWEPWDSRRALRVPQPRYRLRAIAAGRFDGYVRRWARALRRFGGPVRLRLGHEMNGNWYPWSEDANSNRPGEFVEAWRHVWQIFRDEGATNVRWVWSPVALAVRRSQYPGDRYVDRVGLTGFVGGYQLRFKPFRPFREVFGGPLADLRRIAPRKPVELSEIGVAEHHGRKPRWIRDMLAFVRRTPAIDAIVWFELDKKSDWRIRSSPAAARAFAAGVADPAFGAVAPAATRAGGRARGGGAARRRTPPAPQPTR